MKKDKKRKFFSDLRYRGRRSKFGFKDVDIEVVNSNESLMMRKVIPDRRVIEDDGRTCVIQYAVTK